MKVADCDAFGKTIHLNIEVFYEQEGANAFVILVAVNVLGYRQSIVHLPYSQDLCDEIDSFP